MFELTKTEWGAEPTIDWLAKVIALWFQDAVGQNFGWLKERAKKRKKREKVWRNEFVIILLKKTDESVWKKFVD